MSCCRWCVVAYVALASCSRPVPGETTTSAESSTGAPQTSSTGPAPTSTGDPSSTTTGEPTTSGTTMTPDACDLVAVMPPASTGGEVFETTDGVCMDAPAQPNNSACTESNGCGCSSGLCYYLPILGGVCGECMVDADCPAGGCTGPNPIQGVGAACNDGGRGAACLSDGVCSDATAPYCAQLLLAKGILSVATCSECRSNVDCVDPAANNCTPSYDLVALGGMYTCEADASVPNGRGCNRSDCMGAPIGNRACASGFCGSVLVFGMLELGVCGECNSDADCPDGKTCSPGSASLDTGVLLGATCV